MPINPDDRQLTDEMLIEMFTDPPLIPVRSAPAFLYDEGVEHTSIVTLREKLKLYVTTVQDQRLTGETSDLRILAHARGIGCTLVAHDKAYPRHHERLSTLGLSHAGILYVPRRRTPQDVIDWIEASYERAIEIDAPDLLYYELWRV
jgi:hypothetical protein